MTSSKKSLTSFLVPLALVLAAVLYFTVFRNDAAGIVLEKKTVERGDVRATVETTGTLNPVTVVDVGSQVSGLVSLLHADFNSVVKKGQILAELDQAPFLQRVRQAEASLKNAQAAVVKAKVQYDNVEAQNERAKVLFGKDLISVEEKETVRAQFLEAKAGLVAARSGLRQAKSQLEAAKVDLSYTVIKSPIDGVVINRAVNVGQTVAARFEAPVLFQIADDLTKMRVECPIRESRIGMVRRGQPATFFVDAYPGVAFRGVVSQVRFGAEQVQNVVRYTTVVDVDNSDLRLLPGMTANVDIDVGTARNVLLVPNAALRFVPPSDLSSHIDVDWAPGGEGQPGLRTHGPNAGAEEEPGAEAGSEEDVSLRSLWVEEPGGGIRRVLIRPGLTNTSQTEVKDVVSGELHEGDAVIIWAKTPETDKPYQPSRRDMHRIRRFLR
jgi:HlyD family secretion protein